MIHINVIEGNVGKYVFKESLRLVKANKQFVISTPETLAKARPFARHNLQKLSGTIFVQKEWHRGVK